VLQPVPRSLYRFTAVRRNRSARFEMSASYARRHAELACSGYAVGLAIVIVRAGSFETEVSQDDAQG